nr:triple tyrosine motif-containing protein [uncultured Draconibacterium sp.]
MFISQLQIRVGNFLPNWFVLFVVLPLVGNGQINRVGVPVIQNFLKSDYMAGTQNWAIAQSRDGKIFFANNDGLLSYDGIRWELLPISSSSPLRSVFVDKNNVVYVGLINDFGYIKREEPHAPVFVSLKTLLPDGILDFDDVWRIHETRDGIIFQCYDYIFIYNENHVKVIQPENLFYSSFNVNQRLLVQESERGLFELKDSSTERISYWDEYKEKNIRTIMSTPDDKLLIGTETDGLYIAEGGEIKKWKTPVNDLLIDYQLYSGVVLPGNLYAFGTILNGLIISDEKGNVVQKFTNKNGLHNNTILSLFADQDENLWLGLDNGIDYIELSSPLNFVGADNIGSGYTCKVFQDKLYLGTNQGLYAQSLDDNESGTELVGNTAGQVWSLEVFDGELVCGHHQGTFRIEGNKAFQIAEEEGAWKYIKLKGHDNYLLGGHYFGLVLLKKINNRWQFYKKLEGFEESSRYLQQDESGDIWIGHSGKGIFRITLSDDLEKIKNITHYTDEKGLPSIVENILLNFQSRIFVSNSEGIYAYDAGSDSFIFSDEVSRRFENCGRIKVVAEGANNETWFIGSKESGVIRQNEDMSYTRITAPFKQLNNAFVNEFEFIYPYNEQNVFFGFEDGFVHYSSGTTKLYNKPFKAYLSKIELPYLDSSLFIDQSGQQNEYSFPFRKNAFRFHFSAPYFETNVPVQFSYFLEGFSEDWSVWSTDYYKDFTTLHEGSYTLKVKARNLYEIESEISSFSFDILPPWHRSGLAYFIYIIVFSLLTFVLTKYILYRLDKSKEQEKIKHQQEIIKQEEQFQREALIAEKEIIKLRNDKLRAEMIHRDKELANQTMGIIQKNKFMIKVNEDLNAIQDFVINETAKNRILSLKRRIKKEIDIKRQSQIFETYFDEVHEEFFKKLKERFPKLTPNDLRICAFIRMNLTTQEIAAILNISYRGAEISRYRLRKKLGLDRSTNLSSFLTNI